MSESRIKRMPPIPRILCWWFDVLAVGWTLLPGSSIQIHAKPPRRKGSMFRKPNIAGTPITLRAWFLRGFAASREIVFEDEQRGKAYCRRARAAAPILCNP
jgi:hypothetical protein